MGQISLSDLLNPCNKRVQRLVDKQSDTPERDNSGYNDEDDNHQQNNLFDIRTNLRMGCTILKHYIDRSNGDLVEALQRYNGSLRSNKYSNKVLDRLNKRWFKK